MQGFTDLCLSDRMVHSMVSSSYARHAFHCVQRCLQLVEVCHVVRGSSAREHCPTRPVNALRSQKTVTKGAT